MFKIITSSPEQTRAFGAKTAGLIKDGLVICLEGDLGAGKTLFTQGFCSALHMKEPVTSPTFNLMNVYEGDRRIYHFDLYRLENEDDLYEIGFYEYTDVENEIALIEWPDRFINCLPDDYLYLTISRTDKENEREITISLHGKKYRNLYEEMKNTCQF